LIVVAISRMSEGFHSCLLHWKNIMSP
jgi:hypothetical protein